MWWQYEQKEWGKEQMHFKNLCLIDQKNSGTIKKQRKKRVGGEEIR